MAKSLTKAQRDILQEWIDDTKSGLGLSDWKVKLSREPCNPTAQAHVDVNFESRFAIVCVDKDFMGLSLERQAEVIVHELLHLWVAEPMRLTMSLESFLSDSTYQLFDETYRRSMELVVDGIARAIAHTFNPIEWDECDCTF